MAFIPALNTAQVQMQYAQSNGDFAENTFWVQRGAAWTGALLNALCETFIDWFEHDPGTGSFKAFMSAGTTLVNVSARDFTTQAGVVGSSQEGLPIAGTDAGADVAKGLSFALTARTGLAGRSFRGRIFMCGLTNNFITGTGTNVVDATHAAHVVLALNTLLTDVTAADALDTVVVASRFHNLVPRAAMVMTPITAWGFHDLFVDFQRRRAPAHNRHH